MTAATPIARVTEALREMDEKATKGPWGMNGYEARSPDGVDVGDLVSPALSEHEDASLLNAHIDCGYFKRNHDRDLCATLRNALPALRALIEAGNECREVVGNKVPGGNYDAALVSLADVLDAKKEGE